jgi:hypothetical protein
VRKIFAAFLSLLPLGAFAAEPALWQHVSESSIPASAERPATGPKAYKTLRLDQNLLGQLLAKAPLEFTPAARQRELIITIPKPDGSFARFRIEESPMVSPQVAAQVPDWKTYSGRGIDDPTAVLRFSWSANGLSAMVLGADGAYYVEPYSKADRAHYRVFHRRDAGEERGSFHCGLDEYLSRKQTDRTIKAASSDAGGGSTTAAALTNGATLRTYRIAIATTAEYTADRGGQTSAFQDVMNAVNRINTVYRRDASISFTLVSDTRTVYQDATADPYNNTDNEAQLPINQTTLDNTYGSDNYDIGHLFGTGGGGIASTPSVCSAQKAEGYSARVPATGDPFWVDYVAHEIGHQLSAEHTYNTKEAGTCSTRSAPDAFEPASGSTIMSYVGICGDRNLQKDAIDMFHVRSLDQIIAQTTTAFGSTCGTTQPTNNSIPTVTAGTNVTIPKLTPFALRATATDGDSGDTLTYSWEQFNAGAEPSGPEGVPAGTYDVDSDGVLRPLFRVNPPTTNPARNFPSLPYILNNANNPPQTFTGKSPTGAECADGITCVTGETLPAVSRQLNFRVVVRDGRGGIADAAAVVNVDAAAGPFVVTAPNSAVSFGGASQQTITWDVANTNTGAVNVANVKITLSTDGGNTFPFVLLNSTPNDGSESITIPNVSTSMGRIKVEAVGNIFFDISDANFTITGTGTAEATQLANISTRMRVETGDNALIGGIIIMGNQPKKIIVRAIGPSLGLEGRIEDPQLQLVNAQQSEIAFNNNWRDAANQQEIAASGVAPNNDLESAILITLQPGNYTAIVRGVNNTTGIGVAEIYDLDRTVDSKLANISTRGIVRTDPNVMIGGFIVVGQNTQRVIIRALGPSLSNSGVQDALQDPTLDLVDNNGSVIRRNNNWRESQQAEIEGTGIPPQNDAESAIVETLAPGPYTAIVRGVGQTTGIAVVEVYALN